MYQPRVHVVRVGAFGKNETVATYSFPETIFVAVTAYQNDEVSYLVKQKIQEIICLACSSLRMLTFNPYYVSAVDPYQLHLEVDQLKHRKITLNFHF
jgi:hypothetical protein